MALRTVCTLAGVMLGASLLAAPAIAQEQQEPNTPQPAQVDPARLQQVDPAQLQRIDRDQLQAVDRSQFQVQDFTQLRPVVRDDTRRDPRLAVIDWTAAYEARRIEQSEYGANTFTTAAVPNQYLPQIAERSAERVRPVHMPVLLPRRNGERMLTRMDGEPGMMVITRPHFYDASYSVDGVSVQISGTRRINHRASASGRTGQAMNAGRDSEGMRIVADQMGYTADFTRFGAAYTVSVECGSSSDPRCADESFIRDVVRRLVVAGGNPEEGEG